MAVINLTAEDNASKIIDHVTKRLGVFNKEGLAMGIGFAAITKGIDLAMQSIQMMIDYVAKGIEMNRNFEYSLVLLKNSFHSFGDETIDTVTTKIRTMSIVFGTSLSEMTDNLRNLAREGYNASEAINMLYSITLLSKTANEDNVAVQNAVTTALNTWGYNYKSTGNIVDKFNDLMDTTGLTLSEINNIIANNSTEIQKAGIDFYSLVDIIYSLYKTGSTTGRALQSDLKPALEDLDSVVVLSTPHVSDLNTSWDELASTAKGRAEILKQVREDTQMGIGGKLDFFGYLDERKFEEAEKYVEEFKDKGIVTLNEFKEWWDKEWFWTSMQEDTAKLVAGMIQENELIAENNRLKEEAKPDEEIAYQKQLIKNLEDYKIQLQAVDAEINNHNENIAGLNKQISDATIINEYNEDLRYMQMGLIDASYASKIHNSATRELILSIKTQQDAIDKLNEANQEYSYMEQKNSLEIMRIQYDVMGQRRGATRQQENLINEIERANMDLRIKTAENQLEINEITTDMSPLMERLEQTRLWYNEEIYTVQDAYNKEIQALRDKIAAEEQLLIDSYARRREIIAGRTTTQGALYESYQTTPPVSTRTSNPVLDMVNRVLPPGSRIPYAQTGGYVAESGLAVIHRGETVLPANTSNNINVNVGGITIHSNGNENYDADRLAQALSKAFNQKLINTNISNYRRR